METPKSFRVGIRRKVPYLTNFFLILAGICFLVILVFELLFSPFKNGGQEVQTTIFYWLVPDFWKKVFIVSLFGFCLTTFIYIILRFYKSAILIFYDKEIIIRGRAVNLIIPIKTIRRVYCNDAKKVNGEPKGKLSITIEWKRKPRATAIRLKDYNQADEFIEQLIKYENLDIKVYDFTFNPIHLEEE